MKFKYKYVRLALVGIFLLHIGVAVLWAKYYTIEMSMDEVSFEAEGQTELMRAVIEGKPAGEVRRIVEENISNRGFDRKRRLIGYKEKIDWNGNTALHYALYKRRPFEIIDIVRISSQKNRLNKVSFHDLVLYSRWKNDDGDFERLYSDPKIQAEMEDHMFALGSVAAFLPAGIIWWIASIIVCQHSYKKKLVPAVKVLLRIGDMLLYLPVYSIILFEYYNVMPIYDYASMLIFIETTFLGAFYIGVSIIPVMFFYNYMIPVPDSIKGFGYSLAPYIMLILPYYIIKYFILLLIKGDPVKRGEDTPVNYSQAD